jgi:hypothetical protein
MISSPVLECWLRLSCVLILLPWAENYRTLTAAFSFSSGVQGVFLRGAYYFRFSWVSLAALLLLLASSKDPKRRYQFKSLSLYACSFDRLYLQVLKFTRFYADSVLTCCRICTEQRFCKEASVPGHPHSTYKTVTQKVWTWIFVRFLVRISWRASACTYDAACLVLCHLIWCKAALLACSSSLIYFWENNGVTYDSHDGWMFHGLPLLVWL